MMFNFLYSMLMATFPIMPLLYKSCRESMIAFYDKMVWRYSMRRLYGLMVFLFLVSFHFYYLTIFRNHYDVLVSTVITYALVRHKWFEAIVRVLQNYFYATLAMTTTLILLFLPHMFTLGVTIGTVLIAAIFYPSKLCLDRIWKMDDYNTYKEYGEALRRYYFQWELEAPAIVEEPTRKRIEIPADAIEDAEVIEYIENDKHTD